MELTLTQKETVYRNAARYNFLGHTYIGFEGKDHLGRTYSQAHSCDRKRMLAECDWVWDVRRMKWIKRPKEAEAAALEAKQPGARKGEG